MRFKTLTLILFALLFIGMDSYAQSGTWEKLGTRRVDYGLDRDVIPVGVHEGGFTKLKVVVNGGAINMHKMIVTFGNGDKQEIQLKHNFRKGANSRVIDLKGRKRVIKKIVMVYDTKNLARSKAVVRVFGRH